MPSFTANSKLPLKLIAVVALPVLLIAAAGLAYVFPNASNQGYAPAQPIPFSHKKHAGLYQIPCQYCHVGVERSKHASIPAVGVCMNCHSVVKTDSPLIQQIKAAYDKNEPIEWVRIHEVPDYVYFPHKRHIAAGLACENCHGDIKTMDRVYQFAAVNMGWCMDCHRGKTTPRQVRERLADLYPERADALHNDPHGPVAPVECSTCHN